MIFEFRNKSNDTDEVFLDAHTKAEAREKLRAMLQKDGRNASDYKEVIYGVSPSKNHSG